MQLKNLIAAVVLAAASAAVSAADLPGGLKGVPEEKIVDISKSIYGPQKNVEDPESPTGKAAVYVPAADAKQYGGIGMGVYIKSTKQVVGFIRPKPLNEKYTWYKIPRNRDKDAAFPGGKYDSQIYLENWRIGAWVPADLKGKYDCWILVKAQGPFYVEGSEKENKLFLARVLMIPAGLITGDLPEELRSVPAEKIIDISGAVYGTKVVEPESPAGHAVLYVPAEDAKQYGGINMGVYIKSSKQTIASGRPKPQNEEYNWYKIPRREADAEFPGGKNNTNIYLENWRIGAWVPADLKGKYDCWVSVKAQGPFYVEGSEKENKLFLDRVLLVPLK